MRKLLEFIRSTYVFIIFVVAEVAALNHYAHSSVYARAKILSRAAYITGRINGGINGVRRYFALGRENELLLTRLAELENRLAAYETGETAAAEYDGATEYDGMEYGSEYDAMTAKYAFTTARVVSASVNKRNNFLIIDKGMNDGVRTQMGVVSPRGAMVGYVAGCSNRYAAVVPVLNTSFRASGILPGKGGNHSAPIKWGGNGMYEVQLEGLSKYANPETGDTVVTSGHSNIFPRGILIGRVKRVEMNDMQTAYNIDVELAADISALHRVILIDNRDLGEIQELQQAAEQNNFKH